MLTAGGLPEWTLDPTRVERRLSPRRDANEWEDYDAALLAAFDLDAVAVELMDMDAATPSAVSRAAAALEGLAARFGAPVPAPRVALDLLDAAVGADADDADRGALARRLAGAAYALADHAGAPRARDAHALREEVAEIVAGIAPLLTAWLARLPNNGLVAVATTAPTPPLRVDDGAY